MINNSRVPVGLPDVGHYPELFVALLDSGTWDVEDLKKLAGLNFLRVLTEVEQVKETGRHLDKANHQKNLQKKKGQIRQSFYSKNVKIFHQ